MKLAYKFSLFTFIHYEDESLNNILFFNFKLLKKLSKNINFIYMKIPKTLKKVFISDVNNPIIELLK